MRGGTVVERLRRPLRYLHGKPAITYRKVLWPVHDGAVYLDGEPPPSVASAGTSDLVAEIAAEKVEIEAPPNLTSGWDSSQLAVISEPKDARILVDAGPGTGKTAVACARIAMLIESRAIEPVNCLIISFTNTAVHELRGRIGGYLSEPSAGSGIKIATLDSYAWSLRAGFDDSATLAGTYEEGVAAAMRLILENPDTADYLDRAEHVIIDEAQDIIGTRADFVVELLAKLPVCCGVTVFADEAQAIYGFADDTAGPAPAGDTLPGRLRRTGRFAAMSLRTVHRTSSPVLREVFTTVRGMVLAPTSDPAGRGTQVRSEIERLTATPGLEARTLNISGLDDNSLVLFRRRAEVLMASSLLQATPHRLRMGGMPTCLHPWIGACLFDATAPRFGRAEFLETWKNRVAAGAACGFDAESAWQRLYELAGIPGQALDLRTLRRKLARRSPPPSLCSADLGSAGPVLGTIHGSKGREADTVILLLPAETEGEGDHDEETRIVFVGATRARAHLRTESGFQLRAGNLKSGTRRAYSFPSGSGGQALMVEIGRDGDVSARGLVGSEYFDEASALAAQQACLGFAGKTAVTRATRSQEFKNLHAVAIDGEPVFAVLSPAFRSDLWDLAKIAAGKAEGPLHPSAKISHIRAVGARTIALAADDPELGHLHEPWSSSGFIVAPVLLAFTKIRFWPKG